MNQESKKSYSCDCCGETKERNELVLYIHRVTKFLCFDCYEKEKINNNNTEINNNDE